MIETHQLEQRAWTNPMGGNLLIEWEEVISPQLSERMWREKCPLTMAVPEPRVPIVRMNVERKVSSDDGGEGASSASGNSSASPTVTSCVCL